MDANEFEEREWLKRNFHETPTSGPAAKKVKFSDLHEQLQSQFPLAQLSPYSVSRSIQGAFPNAVSRRCGKSKHKYIFGMAQNIPISATQSETSTSNSPSTSQASAMEGVNVADLLVRIS